MNGVYFTLIILSVIGSCIGVDSFVWPKIIQSEYLKKHKNFKSFLLIMVALLLIGWMSIHVILGNGLIN